MKHFDVIKFVNMLAAILLLVMGQGLLLIMSFTLNLPVADEANFDNWKPYFICSGIMLTSIT
jgi:hypothetical protein